jgi:hypothetical protein
VCTTLPGKPWGFAMWSLGVEGGAAGQIPARPAAGVAGKVAREGLRVAETRLGRLLTAERRPVIG